jgi:hypothetical protein
MDLKELLLKKDKEFYWDCILKYGYSSCPPKIVSMYNSLIKREYTPQAMRGFTRGVIDLEIAIRGKQKAKLPAPEFISPKTVIRYLLLLSNQIPDKPCYYNDAVIRIDQYDKNIIINDIKTQDISYFKKVMKDCRSDILFL